MLPSEQEIASKLGSERRIALVIGNGRYRHASELANPVNDAEAMAAVLARLGFDVVREQNIELDRIGDVQAAFEAKLSSKPDVALLFYAGHGLQVRGLNYLVPIDVQIEVPAHLKSRAIRFNDILEPMTEGAGASLIFLDACRDNPFTRNLARSLGDTARGSVRGGLAKIEKVAGTFIAYATAPDEVAYDGKGLHSPFTAALLKHIETPGFSVADMMIDVRNSVLAETQGRQEPWDQSSLRAKFCFVPKIEELRIEEGAKQLELSPSADEWAAVQNTTSLAVLGRFRERYPDPPWSEYADIRMKELRTTDDKRRKISEEQHKLWWTLQKAILQVFDPGNLRMTLAEGTSRDFDHFVPTNLAYDRQVLALIERADEEGWLGELVDAVLDARKQNARFVATVSPIADQIRAGRGRLAQDLPERREADAVALREAIIESFNRESLDQSLDECKPPRRFAELVPAGVSLNDQVYELIRRANEEGWIRELVDILLDVRADDPRFVAAVRPIADRIRAGNGQLQRDSPHNAGEDLPASAMGQ